MSIASPLSEPIHAAVPPEIPRPWPTHEDLPFEDDAVQNFMEWPQNSLLTSSVYPVVSAAHPDGRFCIGHDCGVYYMPMETPPYAKAIVPDWMYASDVEPCHDGSRKSFVMWDEDSPPSIVIEYASGDGAEELDRTPRTGKMWIYERKVRPDYYAVFVAADAKLHVFRTSGSRFVKVPPNSRERYPVEILGLELGTWHGTSYGTTQTWLRWFTPDGELLPTAEERAETEKQRAEAEKWRAVAEKRRAEAEKQRAEAEKRRAEAEKRRAEAEKQRADEQTRAAEAEKQRADEAERQAAELRAEIERLRNPVPPGSSAQST